MSAEPTWREMKGPLKKRIKAAKCPLERAFLKALAEGMKPSPMFYDDPMDMGSLYWRRVLATVEAALAVIAAGRNPVMVDECTQLVQDVRNLLP